MKRLLLVSYVFPPEASPGALRPAFLAKYLPQFGWDVSVLTHSAGSPAFAAHAFCAGDVLKPFARLPYRLQDVLTFPDTTARWIPQAVRAGSQLLQERPFDAILGSALPASVHIVSYALARKSGLPWIADYRDPWTGNAYVRRGRLRAHAERRLECGLLAHARAITTISEPIAGQLRALHRRDVAIVPNAFDPSEWDGVSPVTPANFDLVYTGSMYDGKRSPDLLFAALAALQAAGDPAAGTVRVHFYGPNSGHVARSAAGHGVSPSVREYGVVPRSAALQAQRSSAAVLIFLNMNSATSGEMGSKFLEYIGSRRPILAFGPQDSVMREFIARHRLGWFASGVEEAVRALRSAYAHFAAGSPDREIDMRSFPTATDMARRFAVQLDAVTGTQPKLVREAS